MPKIGGTLRHSSGFAFIEQLKNNESTSRTLFSCQQIELFRKPVRPYMETFLRKPRHFH